MAVRVAVEFAAPPDRVRAYLRDPSKRPEWQSSLRTVTDVRGGGEVGTTWRDVTWPGLRPHMEVTVDTPARWAETGRWRGVAADLELHFEARGAGTTVVAEADVRLPGPLSLVGRAMDVVTAAGIRSDLRRAARLVDAAG